MRITTKGRYALRAVLSLAQSNGTKPVSIKQLAAQEKLSPEFLEQIFFKLKNTGVIISTRGPGGGFKLNRDPKDITLLEIIEGAGEETDITPCASLTTQRKECPEMKDCNAHKVWKKTAEYVKDYFSGITLESILAESSPAE